MIKEINVFKWLPFALVVLMSCKATKTTKQSVAGSAPAPQAETVNSCSQVIKYYSEKTIVIKTSQEMTVYAQLTINPGTKTITMAGEVPGEGKANFDITIEHLECSLNAGLTAGEALYSGFIRQEDGPSTRTWLKIEIMNGGLVMTGGQPEKESEMQMLINKWEIVKE